jgi:RPA family protein
MSASNREVAHRVFAAEYDDATFSYSESDEERAPNYLVTPTGARVNRVFLVGVLTEVEQVSDEVLRARVADPTGAFVVYAGQYQPDEMAFLESAEPPMFVAVTGKARTFSPDDSDRVFTSVRPESISEVDADTRDRWTVQAAERTLARVATTRAAMDVALEGEALADALRAAGAPEAHAAGVPLALDHYGTTEHYLAAVADLATEALEQVAGERDEVAGLSVTPGDAGDGTVDAEAVGAGIEDAVVDVPEDSEPVSEPTGDENRVEDEAPDDTEPAPDDGAETASEEPDEEPDDLGDFEDADEEAGASSGDEDLGDFEPGGVSGDDEEADAGPSGSGDDADVTDEDADVTDDGEMEDVLDDDERERLEEEYGTFESGTEVSEPGEADIEPEGGPIEPDDGDLDEEAAEHEDDAEADVDEDDAEAAETEEEPEAAEADTEAGSTDVEKEPEDEPEEVEGATEADTDEDVDLDEAVMDAMEDLDDGDGADREKLVAAVVDDHGVDPGAVQDAIQDALMAGKCYEPDDQHVKPI